MATPPSAYNLLELYRQHRDEIDAITDPVTLFILAYVNYNGEIRLNALAKELGLSSAALNKTLLPLYRSQLITESGQTLWLTALGKRVLEELGFIAPPIPPTKPSEPPKQSPKPPAPPATGLRGIGFLGGAIVVLIGVVIIGALVLPGILNPPTLPPTRAPLVITQPPTTAPYAVPEAATQVVERTHTATPTSLPTFTPASSHTFTPTSSHTFTPTSSRTFTPTPSRTFTPTLTRTPTVDTQGPPAPTALSLSGGTLVSCSGSKILRWSSVSDPAGIARYEWALERSPSGAAGPYSSFASGNTSSLTATPAMQCGTWYRWRVRAVDGLGNAGAYCAYAYFSIGID